MKTYDDYRPSGVQWIGKIPSHWEVLKTKFICSSIYAGGTPSTTRPEYWNGDIPWVASGACHDCEISEGSKFITEIGLMQSSTKMIPANTALVAMTGATCANTGYLKINACANQSVTAYINIPDFCDSRYLWYVLQSAREELLTYKTGGAQGGINVKDCANIKVCLPPLAEQEAIAKYLDYKAVQVDSIIDNNQHQIALLEELKSSVISHAVTRGINLDVPLKASGVDGLGDIPQHWKTTLFKRLLREPMMYGANESAESYKESEPRFIRITDITLDGKLNNDNKASLSRSKAIKYMLHKGDLLFARSGATVGKCYLFKEDIEACFAGYLIKAQCDKELMPEYMRYYCQSHYYNEWKAQSFIQSTIQNISAERYSYLPVTLPPVDEQEAIAKYLDQRTAKINAQIAKIQMQNQLLQEYKSSLISEVVTGKRKVID